MLTAASHNDFAFASNDANATTHSCHRAAAAAVQLHIRDFAVSKADRISVLHVRQQFSWDCGLACVLMVLHAVDVHSESLFSLWRRCRTVSIWTIDLAHLLRQFGISVRFMTRMLGANPAYAEEQFYMDHMQTDALRVHAGFRAAAGAGIDVCACSLSSAEIGEYLQSGRYVAIMLVDKCLLDQSLWNKQTSCTSCWSAQHLASLSYTGHYIVACGYRSQSQEFLLLDPAAGPGQISLHATGIDMARRAFGTDEDLLLIQLPSGKHLAGSRHE